MHSELFSGRSFAFFPVIVFLLSFGGFWLVLNFSTLAIESLSHALTGLGVFLGLSVASIGFSSKDAVKNVLGTTNFLVYSSRTLPVSSRRLITAFLVKDIIYYFGLFLVPTAVGSFLAGGTAILGGIAGMSAGFLAGLMAGVVLARTSLKIPGIHMNYAGRVSPLADKTLMDVSRSAGGFFKVVFSIAVLTGFYWFAVLYFPFTSSFLMNPVLSFSILLGTVSITAYNWINRFDAIDDYIYLPVEASNLLEAKQKAFLMISLPMTAVLLLGSFAAYSASVQVILLSFLAGFSVQLFTAGSASYLTGLDPNSRMYESTVFLKLLGLIAVFTFPLLIFSIFFRPELWLPFVFLAVLPGAVGIYLIKKSRGKIAG